MYAAALHGSRGLLHFLITPCKSPRNCGHYKRHTDTLHENGFGLGSGVDSGRNDPGYPSILTPEGLKPFDSYPPYDIAKDLNSRFKVHTIPLLCVPQVNCCSPSLCNRASNRHWAHCSCECARALRCRASAT